MSPALPPELRRRTIILDAPHPRIGSPCWIWTGGLACDGAAPGCGWRRCCNPGHAEPAAFPIVPTEPVSEGVQAHA